jgi:hypothetical protein
MGIVDEGIVFGEELGGIGGVIVEFEEFGEGRFFRNFAKEFLI